MRYSHPQIHPQLAELATFQFAEQRGNAVARGNVRRNGRPRPLFVVSTYIDLSSCSKNCTKSPQLTTSCRQVATDINQLGWAWMGKFVLIMVLIGVAALIGMSVFVISL